MRKVGFLRRAWQWLEDRSGLVGIVARLARHTVPKTGWGYVFGSATLAAFALQVLTGIALATMYVPATNAAYQSLGYITQHAFLGSVVRGLHYFGASAMVVLIGIHMARVFLTGSYKFPRELNWVAGALLFLLTLAMAFTGQLLRWDQNAVWAVVVGAEQAGRVPLVGHPLARFVLGGDVVGASTLSRFFATHVFYLPAAIFALLGLHLFLVIRHGISERPKPGKPVDPATYREEYDALLEKEGRPFWPDAAWRDVVFGVLVVAVVVGLAVALGPPLLGKPPDPSIIGAEPRPDWYFLWYFALLALLPPSTEPYVMVLGPLLLAFVILALPLLFNRGERHPSKRPWSVAVVGGTVVMIATLTVAGFRSPWSPDFTAKPLPEKVVGTSAGPIAQGAALFHDKGCEYCHAIGGHGGHRGPDLTYVADRMTREQMTLRILNGRRNMPSFASILGPHEMDRLLDFLESRSRHGTPRATAPAGRAEGSAPDAAPSE